LNRQDCEECYTLTFNTDTTAEGLAYKEKIVLNLSLLGQYTITDIGRTDEDNLFVRALYNSNTKSYSATSDKLKFINNIDHYYLLFKRIES